MSTALRKILTDLTRLDGVKGVVVVSKDGMVLDAVVPQRDFDAEDLGAAVSGIMNGVVKIGGQFELGGPKIITMEYEDGMIVTGDLGENFVLVIADKSAMVGMIRNEIKRQRDRLKALVG